MFNKVMVGVDGGEGGLDAIALARRLLKAGGELTLAHIYRDDRYRWRATGAMSAVTARDHAAELLDRARNEAGVQATLRWRGAASVGRGLHELAELAGADLLVTGSSRRGLLGRVLVGDDTRAALNGAPCAVAIAPAGYHREPVAMREIGVGYDGSPESEHALAVARALAAEHGTKLSAFQAVSIPSTAYAGVSAWIDWESIEQIVRDARERIAGFDGIEPHAAYGNPVEELTVYSASLDLLVVGSRSYGPLGRLVHGSTAQQLARTARCPLLVLTRAAREAAATGSEDGRGLAVTST